MKNILLFFFCMSASCLFGQINIELKLNHEFDGSSFMYNQVYTNTTPHGKKVELTRVQYYLSNFKLKHDGGQVTDLSGVYVLASGNVSQYDLGSYNISQIDSFSFDLGVDSLNNHIGVSNWPSTHPLAAQAPAMDWGWPAGYLFLAVEGQVDADGDNVPETAFLMHGIGDHLLQKVNISSALSETGGTIEILLHVNIADWLKDIDLTNVGIQMNGGAENQMLCANTNTYSVFSTESTVGLGGSVVKPKNNIYVNYQLSYAPTICYQLITEKKVDLTLIDQNGRIVLKENALQSQGNFFIQKELANGMYIAQFVNEEVRETCRVLIKK